MPATKDLKGEERPVKTPFKEPEMVIIQILKLLHKGVQSKVKGRPRKNYITDFLFG